MRKCGGSKNKIKKRLPKVPETMAKKYNEILGGVSQPERQTTKIVLMWLLRHERVGEPLTQAEMAAAARLSSVSDFNKLRITAMTMSSKKENTPDHSVELESPAKDHLQERLKKENLEDDRMTIATSPRTSWFCFSDADAHFEIATRCLEILLSRENGNHQKKTALQGYAAQYWHQHYNILSQSPASTNADKMGALTRDVGKLLTQGSLAFKSWLRSYNPDKDFEPDEAFDILSETEYEMAESVQNSSSGSSGSDNYSDTESEEPTADGHDEDEYSDEDSEDHRGSESQADPVYYAVKLGLLDMATELIKKEAPHAGLGREGNVLQLALYREHWDVANTLLNIGGDLKNMIAAEAAPHGTPLYIASAKAEGGLAKTVLNNLIEKGARAEGTKDGKLGSALHAAAYFDRDTTVRLLLDHGGASVEQEGGMFGTALHAAAARGNTNVVRELLDRGAHPARVSGLLGTPLQAALTSKSSDQGILEALQEAIETKLKIRTGIKTSGSSGIGWKRAIDRLDHSTSFFLTSYKELFPMSSPSGMDFQMPSGNDLTFDQELLAGLLERWTLPEAEGLMRVGKQMNRHVFSPVPRQLADIERALPTLENQSREQEMNRPDFYYKAMFWSGVDYIMEVSKSLLHIQDRRNINNSRLRFLISVTF